MKEEKKRVGEVKFKAEPTRHFPRYKIPAYVEIGGKRFKVKDWSLGGCAIYEWPEEYLEKKWLSVDFVIPFDTFEIKVKDLRLEPLQRQPDGSVGCRFTELRPDQLSVLQDIIEAYLEGSIVTLEEFINTVKREDLREALEARRPTPPRRSTVEEVARRIFITSLFILTLAVLLGFILKALQTRVYTVQPLTAFYQAEVLPLKSPMGGFFKSKIEIQVGKEIKKGEVIGIVESPAGFSFLLRSPAKGLLAKVKAEDGTAVEAGEPILYLLPEGEKLWVEALIPYQELRGLRLGQTAEVVGPEGRAEKAVVEDIVWPQDPGLAPSLQTLVRVKLKPLSPKTDPRLLGKVVGVRIDLSPRYLRPLFRLLP